MKPPTLPQIAEGWRLLLSQFSERSTRLLVAGDVLQAFGRVLAELGHPDEGGRVHDVGTFLFDLGARESRGEATDALFFIKKGTPREPS